MKYCKKNGHPNPDEAKFCGKDGDQEFTPTPPKPPELPQGSERKGHKTATVGALLVVFGFLLPWVSVSCSSVPSYGVTFTGWELAAGKVVQGQSAPGSPLIFVFLLAGLTALVVLFPAWVRGHPEPRERYELIGLAAIALVLGWLQFAQIQNTIGSGTLGTYKADLLIGFWFTLGGYIGVILGAIGLIDK